MIDRELFSKIHELMPIACVDVVIYDLMAGLLLVKRSIEPEKGKWWFPGGRVKRMETLGTAVRRIAQDEVGLKLGMIRQLKTEDTFFDPDPFGHGKGTHTINTLYLAFPLGTDVKIDANHSDYRWFHEVAYDPEIPAYIKNVFEKLDFDPTT
jgi:colanic acid biosynthesis protein WcaH